MSSADVTVPFRSWDAERAAGWIRVPGQDDHKYTRGVLGVVSGSRRYPGAAVLGVEAALHVGLGMVRYLGPRAVGAAVLARRPEAVTSAGRVQAWLLGSGQDPADRGKATAERLDAAVADGRPLVIDAGALDLLPRASAPVVITPHHGELSALLGSRGVDAPRAAIDADPDGWARFAARELGVAVLLKGPTTWAAAPGGELLRIAGGPAWLGTAGAGDALAGVLGALLAAHGDRVLDEPQVLAPIAATASWLHGRAATLASEAGGGGPFTILGLIERLPTAVGELATRRAG